MGNKKWFNFVSCAPVPHQTYVFRNTYFRYCTLLSAFSFVPWKWLTVQWVLSCLPWCQFSRSSLVSARVSGLPLSTTELCQQHYCKNERDISFVSFFSICSHETLNELFFHEMLDEFSVHKMCEAVLINTRRLPFTPGFINQGGINTSMCAIALAIPLSPHTLGTGMRP